MTPTAPPRPSPLPRPSPARRALRAALAATAVLAAATAASAASAPAAAAGAFDLQGHRGARAVAPENTIAGFDAARAIGVTTIELDVAMTRDGHVVVSHDPRLNPDLTRDADGAWIAAPGAAIVELTLAELQRHDVGRLRPGSRYAAAYPRQRAVDGQPIPTLDAVFAAVRAAGDGTLRFNVETKLSPLAPGLAPEPGAFVAAILDVVDRHRLRDRVTIQSFDWRTLREVARRAPDVATAALTARLPSIDNLGDPRWTAGLRLADHGGSVPRLVRAVGASTWSPHHVPLTEADVREAQALGLRVVPWTVNDPAAIERLLDWGVDGLISDDPARVRDALARRGRPLPR